MLFERTLLAGWADMDFNSHMRNSAYLDKCSDVRVEIHVGPTREQRAFEKHRALRLRRARRRTPGLQLSEMIGEMSGHQIGHELTGGRQFMQSRREGVW